jgi:hypothetical protein
MVEFAAELRLEQSRLSRKIRRRRRDALQGDGDGDGGRQNDTFMNNSVYAADRSDSDGAYMEASPNERRSVAHSRDADAMHARAYARPRAASPYGSEGSHGGIYSTVASTNDTYQGGYRSKSHSMRPESPQVLAARIYATQNSAYTSCSRPVSPYSQGSTSVYASQQSSAWHETSEEFRSQRRQHTARQVMRGSSLERTYVSLLGTQGEPQTARSLKRLALHQWAKVCIYVYSVCIYVCMHGCM